MRKKEIKEKTPKKPKNLLPEDQVKDLKGAMKKLLAYIKPYLPAIVIAIILAIASSIFTIIGPNMIREMTDLITTGLVGTIDLGAIFNIAITLIIIFALSWILGYAESVIMVVLSQRMSVKMRKDIVTKVDKLPLKYFDKSQIGDILSRTTNDVEIVSGNIGQYVTTIISAVVLLIGVIVMMIYLNGIMAISAILATIVGFVLMAFIMGKSQKYFVRQQKDLGKLNGFIEETYSGLDIVKVYNAKGKATKDFEKINDDLYDSGWRSQFISGLMHPLMGFVGNFGYVVVCIVGAVLVMNNQISFGIIVSFMIYVRLFSQPLAQLAQSAQALQQVGAASERVFEFLEEEEVTDESHKDFYLKTAKGNVEFRNVKFGYTPDKVIIKDFSADIKAGQKVAIVGPTGAGKTTLVNLLMRFYEVESGDILIDGHSIKEMTRENIHELFCMVLQDTWLFEGSVQENIAYNKENVSLEQIREACIAAGIDHFIKTLPKGYESVLTEATNLSAGERQLITIARALVEDAPLLILDEATSNVDTRTEIIIQEAMDKLMEGRTSFVIAHRLSTIKNSDLILVLEEGDIVESGTHDELLSKNGSYARIYNSQFE